MKGMLIEPSNVVHAVTVARLVLLLVLSILLVDGGGARSVLSSQGCRNGRSASISCDTVAFATASTAIAAHRWCSWRLSKSLFLRPRGAGAVGRRSSVVLSEKSGVAWGGATLNEALASGDLGHTGDKNVNGDRTDHNMADTDNIEGQDRAKQGAWGSNEWGGMPKSSDYRQEEDGGKNSRVPSAGSFGATGLGSHELTELVKAQFDVLASMLNVSRIVLFVRRENLETGAGLRRCCAVVVAALMARHDPYHQQANLSVSRCT